MKNHKGATLVEVMISVVMFVLGLGSLLWVFTQGALMQERGEYVYTAFTLAKNYVERLKSIDFGSLPDAAEVNTVVDQYGTPDSNGKFKRTTTVTTDYNGDTNCTLVVVSVSYTFRGVDVPYAPRINAVIYGG